MRVLPFNETYIRIECDDFGVEQEMSEYFSFMIPGARYTPKFKAGIWDGIIRLYDKRKKTIYKGLLEEVIKFARIREHKIEVDISLRNSIPISKSEITEFVNSLDLQGKGEPLEVREYQYDAVFQAITNTRSLLLSPTSSGKSLIIYSIIRWHIENGRKIMIIVPSIMLVNQLFSDFKDYSSANEFDCDGNIGLLYSGKERVFDKNVIISTWQTIGSMLKSDPKNMQNMINSYEVGIWDEAHSYKSAVVLSVMEKFIKTKYRTGTTGTLDDAKINGLCLVGLMGPVYKVITTKQLMDAGQVVNLKINCIVLEYPEHIRQAYKGMAYQEEIKFLVGYEARNRFIARLASTLKGNVLVLQNFVDKHGAIIVKYLSEITDRKVYFIHGGVDAEDREEIRKILNEETDVIVVATSSLMSTGVNIPSIEHIVFAIPTKSSIRVRQSIGRGLRLKDGKTHCNLWDISDDLRYKKYVNTTFNHLESRIEIYDKESFDYTIKKLPIQ